MVRFIILLNKFQSTLSQGERRRKTNLRWPPTTISIHALARRATGNRQVAYTYHTAFQSTLSQGERPVLTTCSVTPWTFQSTLSQGERHKQVDDLAPYNVISIHALARRATFHLYSLGEFDDISIHALARRATETNHYKYASMRISIHALARRATWHCYWPLQYPHNFNPRSRKESDLALACKLLALANFNPRSRKESDPRRITNRLCCKRFQSTLSQGERRDVPPPPRRITRFQSTLSQGERQKCLKFIVSWMIFQSTLSQGERHRYFG